MDFLNLPSTDRPIVAHTALGPQLAFLSLKGREALSTLYEFEVELVSGTFMLDVRSMLSTELTVEIETSTGTPRYLSGKVIEFALIGREQANSSYYLYKAVVRPEFWYLTQNQDNRIFQNKNVPAILEEVLGSYGFSVDYQLTESYRDWEYCVQYQESDFNFVSRLMEHEGMYYYFKHDNGSHTLVITDAASTHETFPAYGTFTYYDAQGNVSSDNESVLTWQRSAGMTTAKYSVVDFDFRKPQVKLDALTSDSLSGDDASSEIYEWQGGYQELNHADQYARLRMQELKVNQELVSAITTVRGAAPGRLFTLRNHPRMAENQEFLIVAVNYQMGVAGYSTGTNRKDHFELFFNAIPSSVQFRAPRITPQPKTSGPQTAIVVGPAGEELYTDKYGRIKAQFHWDREGKKDENSSCWIRVSSPWAGGGFGGLQLPRIGDEVVVDFIGGNPDRPIVLGRVYNELNMPPVDLPGDANISGFRTQSVFGDSSTENHLLFIDKLGQELVDLRAQYDMVVNILNNLDITVGNNRHETIENDLTTIVTSGNEVREVQSGTRTTIIQGLEKGTFNTGREIYVTSAGQKTEITDGEDHTVLNGGQRVNINGGGNRETTVTGEQKNTVTNKVTNKFNQGIDETVTGGLAKYTHKQGYTHEVTAEDWKTDVPAGDAIFDAQNFKITATADEITITAPTKIKIQAKTVEIDSSNDKETKKKKWDKGIDKYSTYVVALSATALKSDTNGIKNDNTLQAINSVLREKKYVGKEHKVAFRTDSNYVFKKDMGVIKKDYCLKKDDVKTAEIKKVLYSQNKNGLRIKKSGLNLIL